MNLRFLALIRGMREGGELKIFFCFPKGSVTSPQSFDKEGWGQNFKISVNIGNE